MTSERLTPGEVLRKARENAGWGLRELAHKLFMHDTVLARVEGDRAPMFPQGTIRLAALIMGTDGNALVAAIEEAQKPDPSPPPRPEDHPAFWPTYQAMLPLRYDEARDAAYDPCCCSVDEAKRVALGASWAADDATEAVAVLLARDEERAR